jgi:hypothetical protein
MSHKLQPSTRTNHGLNPVVRRVDSTLQPEIASNDADSTRSGAEVGNGFDVPGSDFDYSQTPGRGCADPRAIETPRCEVARSVGYDPTGERAFPCGAPAEVVCEHCGPMCASCAEDTFCDCGDHKLTPLEEPSSEANSGAGRRPVNAVVYIEINCAKCGTVRMGLPLNHRPMSKRKCPACKTKATARYLAHGVTRRKLPFHEVFTILDPNLQTVLPDGKRRTPWDTRDMADYLNE